MVRTSLPVFKAFLDSVLVLDLHENTDNPAVGSFRSSVCELNTFFANAECQGEFVGKSGKFGCADLGTAKQCVTPNDRQQEDPIVRA